MSTNELTLFEPTALEVLNRRGTGLVRLFRRIIPKMWAVAMDRAAVYERALAPYIGSEYSRTNVAAALQDERLGRALLALTKATLHVDREHPTLARLPVPVWAIVPWSALWDRDVRSRVSQTLGVLKEAAASMRRISGSNDVAGSFDDSHPASGDLMAFLRDPEVPTEVAKRLLAGVRSRITMDLVQGARRHSAWKTSDTKQALRDWSADLLSALGLLTSQLGLALPSLPREHAFDVSVELENHHRRRQRLAADARRAAIDLKK